MNFLSRLSPYTLYLKLIGAGIVLVLFVFIYVSIKGAYTERDNLRVETKTQKQSIVNLKDDIKTQKELNTELVKRQDEIK